MSETERALWYISKASRLAAALSEGDDTRGVHGIRQSLIEIGSTLDVALSILYERTAETGPDTEVDIVELRRVADLAYSLTPHSRRGDALDSALDAVKKLADSSGLDTEPPPLRPATQRPRSDAGGADATSKPDR